MKQIGCCLHGRVGFLAGASNGKINGRRRHADFCGAAKRDFTALLMTLHAGAAGHSHVGM